MDLPTRTKQQKAESESYAILLYKLRRLGIFRNLTENDYGIDFEVELVSNEAVTGRYFKAQVKSAKNVNVRASDGVPLSAASSKVHSRTGANSATALTSSPTRSIWPTRRSMCPGRSSGKPMF